MATDLWEAVIFKRQWTIQLILLLVTATTELGYAIKIFDGPKVFLLSTFELSTELHFWIFLALELVLCVCLIGTFTHRFVRLAAIGLACARFGLLNIDLVGRTQFGWLTVGLAMVLAFESGERRVTARRLSILLTSVYGFAAFHKMLNLEALHAFVANVMYERASLLHDVLCIGSTAGRCLPAVAIAVMAAPMDATIALLTYSRRALRFRLVVAGFFHFSIAVVGQFAAVSFALLSLQLLLALLERPDFRVREVSRQFWRPTLIAMTGMVAAGYLATKFFELPIARIPFVVAGFIPFAVLFWNLGTAQTAKLKPGIATETRWDKVTLGLALAFGIFGLSPMFQSIPYSNQTLGWSMFSGLTKYPYSLTKPDTECNHIFASSPFNHILVEPQPDGRVVFRATDPAFLRQIEVFVREKQCDSPHGRVESFKKSRPIAESTTGPKPR